MSRTPFVYSTLHLPRPLTAASALAVLERLAADPHASEVVLEVRSTVAGVEYVLGCRATDVQWLRRLFGQLLPGSVLTTLATPREPASLATRLVLRPRGLALRTDTVETTARAVLAAVDQKLRPGESVILQAIVGPRRRPVHVPDDAPDPRLSLLDALLGVRRPAPHDVRRQLRERAGSAGFRIVIRLAAAGPDPDRCHHFVGALLGALATTRSSGVRMELRRERPVRVDRADRPWFWPLDLTAAEVLALIGWPLGDGDLPGLPPAHPKRLRPSEKTATKQRLFATSAYPGDTRPVGIAIADQMMHGITFGPSGSGKTTALLHLILADIEAGRPVCVVDPKWQLVEDILARIPDNRLDDVVVLNAASSTPVGFNPLDVTGRDPDVVVDGLLAVLSAIFASGWGPRTEDIISAGLRTLARSSTPDQPATLIDLPRILTDQTYRRPRIAKVASDPGLASFWDWYESLGPRAQAQVIAAPLNKIRSLLLRPALVRMLSQTGGSFRLRDIWRDKKIVLVPLNEGLIGPGTAALLGSLVIADLWQATQERATDFDARRRPGTVYVDEAPRFLHLPVSLADALAVSRSLSVGWFLAAQFRSQFPPELRTAVDINARNKIVFATEHADARDFAQMSPDLGAEDFMALPKYHAYVNLVAGGHPSGWAMVETLPPTPRLLDPAEVAARSERTYAAPVKSEEDAAQASATGTEQTNEEPPAADAEAGQANDNPNANTAKRTRAPRKATTRTQTSQQAATEPASEPAAEEPVTSTASAPMATPGVGSKRRTP